MLYILRHIFYSLLVMLTICVSVSHAAKGMKTDDMGDEMSTHPKNTPIALRGGDLPENVTRIVFDGLPKAGYVLKPENNKLHILFKGFSWSFMKDDLSRLKQLNNILDFTMFEEGADSVFTIIYKCNCQADVYKWRNKKIVMDIFPLDASTNPTKTKIWQDKYNADSNPDAITKKSDTQNPKIVPTKESSKFIENIIQTSDNKPLSDNPNDLKSELNALLSQAAKDGIVKFKNTDTQTTQSDDLLAMAKIPAVQKQDSDANNTPKPAQESDHQQIAQNDDATHSISPDDMDTLLPDEANMFKQNEKKCLPDGAFRLPANNPETETFYDDLSKYRSHVIGEFDKTDPEMSLKLAYHYLSYGMGEEAVNALDNFGSPENRGYIARSMAELLTASAPSPDSMFANKKDCGDVHGLWQAYYYYRTGNEKRAADLSNSPDAIKSLSTLPIVLQRHIGTSLALNLVRSGSYKSAGKMIDKIAQETTQFDASVLLVRGLIDAKNGHSERALATLEDVMSKTSGLDQQMAGLALSELKLAANVDLNQRDISTLEELIFLKSKEFIGAQALALMAEHISRSGNFYKAFGRLSKNSFKQNGIKDPVMIKAEQLFKRLAISGEGVRNPDNLQVYYKFPELIPDDVVLHIGFAKQLASLGHDAQAYKILKTMEQKHPEYYEQNDQTFFMGQMLFNIGDYENAVAVLNRPYTDDKEYMTLKAESLNKIGKHQEAYDAIKKFTDIQSDKNRARYALDAKQWNAAQTAYQDASRTKNNPDYYYAAKATGYMSGYDYPGNALDYKNDVDVVFHQSDTQSTGIEDVVKETNHLINMIETRHEKIIPFLKPAENPNNG